LATPTPDRDEVNRGGGAVGAATVFDGESSLLKI
jgi:hypothetical protein